MVLFKNWPFFRLLFCKIGQENLFSAILERKNNFLGYKNKKFKKSKNWHFCKGVRPWFLSNVGHFSNFVIFKQYRQEKCVVWYPRIKKNNFLGYKYKKFKKSKNWHFSKGVSPWFCSKIGLSLGFGPKLAIFPPFFFRQYRPGKCVVWHSRRKKQQSRLKNQEVLKVQKVTFFQRGLSMVLVLKWPFFNLLLGNIGQENVLYDILQRKKNLLGYKNKKVKKSKKLTFWPFFHLFLGNIGQENVLYDILEQQKNFLCYKKKNFKKSKNCIFPKGLPMVLVQNWPYFQFSSLKQYSPGTCVVWYTRTKKQLSTRYKQEVQKVQK